MNTYYILAALILVLLNAFFVAAEFSIVKIRQTQLNLLSDAHAYQIKVALEINKHQDIYLSACQLGITLTSLALGWIGEPAFSVIILPLLSAFGVTSEAIISGVSVGFGFLVITFLHIILGEIAPKSVALRSTETIARYTAVPLHYFYVIAYPLILILNSLSMLFLQLIGYTNSFIHANKFTKDEVKLILGSTISSSFGKQLDIIENSFDIAELSVADLMSPFQDLVSFDSAGSFDDFVKLIEEKKYSRYPIYQDSKENIIGLIHVKDVLHLISDHESHKNIKISDLCRNIISVQDNFSVVEMLKKFNTGLSHLSIVYNEIGDTIGFVTLDNIVSALVGDIRDEYHQVKFPWLKLHNDTYLFKGNTPIYHLEKALDIDLDVGLVSTISGLVTQKIARIPKEKEHIYFENFSIVIKKMKGPHILLVKVIPQKYDSTKFNT